MPKPSRAHKYARIIRFVNSLPYSMAAMYDPVKNIVRIDRFVFDRLNEHEQAQLLFTEEDIRFHSK